MGSKKKRQPKTIDRDSVRQENMKRGGIRHPGSPLRFLLIFLGLLGLFQLLFVTLLAPSELFAGYMRFNTYLSSVILGWLGDNVQAIGDTLVAKSGSLGIKRGCDALQPCGILVGAILAFPAPPASKMIAIAVGCPILLCCNLLRIVTLYYANIHLPNAFELLHEALWPAAFIALAFLLWIIWVQRLGRSSSLSS